MSDGFPFWSAVVVRPNLSARMYVEFRAKDKNDAYDILHALTNERVTFLDVQLIDKPVEQPK